MTSRGGWVAATTARAASRSRSLRWARRVSPSTAAANAADVTTNPGGTGRPLAVMEARLAPLPPVRSTSRQRSSVNGSTSGVSVIGVASKQRVSEVFDVLAHDLAGEGPVPLAECVEDGQVGV